MGKNFVSGSLVFLFVSIAAALPVASQSSLPNSPIPETLLEPQNWSPPSTGTHQLFDINLNNQGSQPQGFSRLGDKVIFEANDGVHGYEPWITDGTASGTFLLKDIAATNTQLSSAYGFTEINGKSIFIGDDGINAIALWVTDGTAAGTQILHTPYVNPPGCVRMYCGAGTSIDIGPMFRGRRTVVMDDGLNGPEIWLTDGTVSGTTQLTDIPGGSILNLSGPKINKLIGAIGDVFYFSYQDSLNGNELWRTDGTPSGTHIVKDIAPGSVSGVCGWTFFVASSWILFPGIGNTSGQMCRVWRTDGTVSGTYSLPFLSPFIEAAHVFDDQIYIHTTASTYNYEWFVTDGSNSDARLISNINPSYGSQLRSRQSARFVTDTSKFVFASSDGISGDELWKSDGTTNGTVRIADISPGSASSSPSHFFTFGQYSMFTADNGTNGTEWWITQGTTSSTQLLKDIRIGTGSASEGFYPQGIALSNTRAVFSANDGPNGAELWITDGTTSGTRLLKNINVVGASSYPSNFTQLSNSLVFTADDGTNGTELWVSDQSGTRLLADIRSGSNSSEINSIFKFNEIGIFVADDGIHGSELWRTDGTVAGTYRLTDSIPGSGNGVFQIFPWIPLGAIRGNEFLFAATDSDHGTELWATQGTVQTTALKADLTPGTSSSTLFDLKTVGSGVLVRHPGGNAWLIDFTSSTLIPLPMRMTEGATVSASGNFAVFTGTTVGNGDEPWVTDGTLVGTHLLSDIEPGSLSSSPRLYTTYGSQIVFVASTEIGSTDIWVTTGSDGGTRLMTDLNPAGSSLENDPAFHEPVGFSVLGSALLLWTWSNMNAVRSNLLLISESSASYATLFDYRSVRSDLAPGTAKLGDSLVFIAESDEFGGELFSIDELSSGPRLLQDTYPGARGSMDSEFSSITSVGSAILFVADDGIHGLEPWFTTVDSGSSFVTLNPARILNTRSGSKIGSADGAADALTINVYNKGGLPTSGIASVALNVTAVDGENPTRGEGYVTVYPCALGKPDASNLNFTNKQTVPNMVIAPVDNNGNICFYVYGKTHLLADIAGYFPT